MTKPIRRKVKTEYANVISKGEMSLPPGKSTILFPCNPSNEEVQVKFKQKIDNEDSLKVLKTSDGYKVSYSVLEESRIIEWSIVSTLS